MSTKHKKSSTYDGGPSSLITSRCIASMWFLMLIEVDKVDEYGYVNQERSTVVQVQLMITYLRQRKDFRLERSAAAFRKIYPSTGQTVQPDNPRGLDISNHSLS